MVKYSFIGKCLLIEENGRKILAIGDLHLGQEESMNKTGVFVTRGMFEEMIIELDKVFARVGGNKEIDEIVLLGDVKHDFETILRQEWSDVTKLFDYLGERARKIVIVKGNHDTIIEPIASRWGISVVNYYIADSVALLHGNRDFKEIWSKKIKMLVVGHGHPAVKLRDAGEVRAEKYKCFLVGKFGGREIIIVPSFSEVSVGSDPKDGGIKLAWELDYDKFDVWVVGSELDALDFGRLGKIK